MSAEKTVTMTVKMPGLTPAQAIALHAMFRFWAWCGSAGASRMVAFYVDGDGNFRIKPEVTWDCDLYAGMAQSDKERLWKKAQVSATVEPFESRPEFDFDPIAWELRK